MRSRIAKYFRKIGRDKRGLIIFIAIFALFIFLRFYQIEERNQFHIDQVNDAWVVKNFIVDGKVPLLGTPARLNSGNFLVPVSILMFYALYKAITGSEKHLLLLGIALGLSFHVHFTSVFHLLIILLTLPFFPRTRISAKYLTYGILAFLVVMLPTIIHMLINKGGGDLISYLGIFYHGIHLRRVMQLISDAFIQFEQILFFPQLKILGFFLLPIFGLFYLKEKLNRNRILFIYLAALWFLVPLFILSLYSGEITDYYFLIGRPIVILILSYFLYRLITNPLPMLKVIATLIIVVYAYINVNKFLTFEQRSLSYYKEETMRRIKSGEKIEFFEGSPESYLYYIYKERHEN